MKSAASRLASTRRGFASARHCTPGAAKNRASSRPSSGASSFICVVSKSIMFLYFYLSRIPRSPNKDVSPFSLLPLRSLRATFVLSVFLCRYSSRRGSSVLLARRCSSLASSPQSVVGSPWLGFALRPSVATCISLCERVALSLASLAPSSRPSSSIQIEKNGLRECAPSLEKGKNIHEDTTKISFISCLSFLLPGSKSESRSHLTFVFAVPNAARPARRLRDTRRVSGPRRLYMFTTEPLAPQAAGSQTEPSPQVAICLRSSISPLRSACRRNVLLLLLAALDGPGEFRHTEGVRGVRIALSCCELRLRLMSGALVASARCVCQSTNPRQFVFVTNHFSRGHPRERRARALRSISAN